MGDCHSSSVTPSFDLLDLDRKNPMIALAGQPNMGKSTLFNLLTGLNQHVGNWPGKTIEHREGTFALGDQSYRIVDLPGTYSLTANSPDEVIAREFILREKPSVVVAVVSAANLERSLYLVAELAALDAPLVVALNMMDVAQQEGIQVEPTCSRSCTRIKSDPHDRLTGRWCSRTAGCCSGYRQRQGDSLPAPSRSKGGS